MRKFVIEVTSDTDDSLDFIKRDLQCEIGCCSTFFDVDSMTVKEVSDEENAVNEKIISAFEEYVNNFTPACTSDAVDQEMLKATLAYIKSVKQDCKWIPVDEQLPDEEEAVEIWLKYDKIVFTAYLHREWWVVCGTAGEKEFAKYEVSHWRKPQPPENTEQ